MRSDATRPAAQRSRRQARTTFDGLVERLVGLIALTIVLTLAWVFFARGCEARRTLNG